MAIAGLWRTYAGAFTVTASAVERLRPGQDVEFGRYGSPDVYVNEVVTGDELVIPAAELTVEVLGAGCYRLRMHGELLLELGPAPVGFRQRDFKPPIGYGLAVRFLGRPPYPAPRWVTLPELVRGEPAI